MRRGIAATLAASAALALIPASARGHLPPDEDHRGRARTPAAPRRRSSSCRCTPPARTSSAASDPPLQRGRRHAGHHRPASRRTSPNGENQRTVLIGDDSTDGPTGPPRLAAPGCLRSAARQRRRRRRGLLRHRRLRRLGAFLRRRVADLARRHPRARDPDRLLAHALDRARLPTLLEAADDTDVSASDFSLAAPIAPQQRDRAHRDGLHRRRRHRPAADRDHQGAEGEDDEGEGEVQVPLRRDLLGLHVQARQGRVREVLLAVQGEGRSGQAQVLGLRDRPGRNEDPSPAKAKFKRVER